MVCLFVRDAVRVTDRLRGGVRQGRDAEDVEYRQDEKHPPRSESCLLLKA